MFGYRVEDWTKAQMDKNFKFPFRRDIYFRLARLPAPWCETVVAASLPVCLADAAHLRPSHVDRLSTLVGGLKRLGTEVPLCSFKQMKRILRYNRRYIYPQFRTFSPDEIVDTLTWIDNINHPESRKEELRQAYSDMNDRGIFGREDAPVGREANVRDAESFSKDESYDEEKALRWINSSLDYVKTAFGPIADKGMERLVEHSSMIKTVPVSERAKAIWDDLGGYGAIAQSSDATAMEDHYANIDPRNISPKTTSSDPRYRISNEFMLYLVGSRPVHINLLKSVKFLFFKTIHKVTDPCVVNRAWRRIEDSATLAGFFKNIIDGYRKMKMRKFGHILVNAILCSGEMNTSFKNTFSMFSMVNFAAYDLSAGKQKTCLTKNEGDDALAVYKGEGPTEKWWSDYGWIVKVEFKGPINEASFCGLIFDPDVLQSVPDIRKHLAKFGWTNRRYTSANRKTSLGLLRSRALSMACEYGGVPILGPLSQRLLYLTKSYNLKDSFFIGLDMYERERLQKYSKAKPWQKPPVIDLRTRALVQKLQNISITQQLECEAVVTSLTLDFYFSLPLLDFPSSWVNNFSKCSTTRLQLRVINKRGREEVCDRLKNHLLSSFSPTTLQSDWGASKMHRMMTDIQLLRRGSI